jgi:hypothetical protein
MPAYSLPPPLTPLADLDTQLGHQGFAVLDASSFADLAGVHPAVLAPLWDDLPPDGFLKDGGRYRRRRHGCFVVQAATPDAAADVEHGGALPCNVTAMPNRAHWQPVEYNALHGGILRWFEPLAQSLAQSADWAHLLCALAAHSARLRGELPGAEPCYVEAHPFRIDTTDGIGRPTPEGAHRDGVDLVVVVLVARVGIKGGETRVFDVRGPQGQRFTLEQPWSALLLDDDRVIHESTPIQPQDSSAGAGHRDTLVLTFRRAGFQGPA